jgi:hypothetical protein
LNPEDLANEMAAARKRREEKTARQLKEARVYAIRSGLRPGSTREEIEERARSFYPRLNEDLLNEAIALVYGRPRSEKVESATKLEPVALVEHLELVDPLDLAEIVEPAGSPEPRESTEPHSASPEA